MNSLALERLLLLANADQVTAPAISPTRRLRISNGLPAVRVSAVG